MPQKLLVPVLVLILYFAFASVVSCFADDKRRHHSPYTHGIRNLHRVHPWLLRGGEPPEEAFKTLADMGVTTVVDLRDRQKSAAKEKTICQSTGLKYIQIPMSHREPPTTEQISQFLQILANAKEQSGKGSVFVHCELGDDRTGCMIAISRIAFDNYTFDDAYQEMLHMGFRPHFDSLRLSVQQYAEQHATR